MRIGMFVAVQDITFEWETCNQDPHRTDIMERHFQVEYGTWHGSVHAHWKSMLGEEVSFQEGFLMIRGTRSRELLRSFGLSAAGDEESALKCAHEQIRVCTGFHSYNGLSCERRALCIISEPAFIKIPECSRRKTQILFRNSWTSMV